MGKSIECIQTVRKKQVRYDDLPLMMLSLVCCGDACVCRSRGVGAANASAVMGALAAWTAVGCTCTRAVICCGVVMRDTGGPSSWAAGAEACEATGTRAGVATGAGALTTELPSIMCPVCPISINYQDKLQCTREFFSCIQCYEDHNSTCPIPLVLFLSLFLQDHGAA